jgi:hypothetical protein
MPDVTPIYNWPIPEDTDLVKDGAEAIRDLAGAIETTVDSSPVGLVHIKTVSFSGAVSHSFGSDADPIFTSDYTNYKIILDDLIGITGDQDISFRIRANTTDLTANDYRRSIFVQDGTSVTGSRSALTSTGFLGSIGLTNDKSSIVVEIQNPQTTKRKTVLTYNVFSSTSTGVVYKCSANTIANTSAYNGFSIFGAYNFSGTMSVYGYKI